MYLRFSSGVEREEAIRMQPFFHEDARIDLFLEEEYDRSQWRPGVCALVSTTGFQTEHVNPAGIPAMFSGFGKVLEIDPITLAGHDMASMRVVPLMHRTRDAPCDIGPIVGPWGSRTASVCIARTWPSAQSFNDAGVYQPFFPPPPPPPFMHNRGAPPFLGIPLSRRLGTGDANEGGRAGNANRGGRQLDMLLRLHGAPPFVAASHDIVAQPGSPPTYAINSLSPWSTVSSRRSHVSITEVAADDGAPALPLAPTSPCLLTRTRILSRPWTSTARAKLKPKPAMPATVNVAAAPGSPSRAMEMNLAETDEDVSDGIESDKEDDQMETLAREVVDRIGSSRKNLLPVLEQMAASSEKSVIIPDNTKAKCKKQAWGPVVATSKMATRNHGGQNVIEKAKEYQKHKNLEVPPSFKGNSFALLHSDVLNGMSRQVNIKIGNDTCDSTFVINELIDNELNQNLKFARDNPTVVLPDNLDVGDVQLSDLSHPRSLISTRSVPDHQLIDPGLGAIVTGRDNSLINNYTSGLS
ncbi:hypothetical protein ACQ4PT_029370 [Festuca glaucescens]